MDFARRFALFLSPLLVVSTGVELGLRRVETMHVARARALETPNSRIQILVTGNSHEAVGIDCPSLGAGCFNLASGSQGLVTDRRLVERYVGSFPGLKLLLIGVSYNSIQRRTDPEDALLFEYNHAYDVQEGDGVELPWLDSRRFSLFATFGAQRSLEYVFAGFRPRTPIPRSWERLPASAIVSRDKTAEGARRRLAMHHGSMSRDAVARNVRALEALIGLARARGARPVLLVAPVSRSYEEMTLPANRALLEETLASLHARLQVDVKNYWRDPRFEEADFRDFDHLGRVGAAKLSSILRSEVVEPALR